MRRDETNRERTYNIYKYDFDAYERKEFLRSVESRRGWKNIGMVVQMMAMDYGHPVEFALVRGVNAAYRVAGSNIGVVAIDADYDKEIEGQRPKSNESL